MRTRSAVTNLVAMATSALVLVSGCTAMTAGHPTGAGATGGSGGGSTTGSTTAPIQKPSTDNLSDVAKDLLAAVKATPWPMQSVDFATPLTTVRLADDAAVTKTVGPAGGDVSLTADGVTYTLQLPKDALLFDTAITLTPITSIGAFNDLPDGTLHGVDMQPHGLQLAAMAQLEITGLPQQDVLGFAYTGAGFDLRPAPIVPDPDRTAVYVSHFSGGGVGPFGAVSEALKNAGLDTGPSATAARRSADVHNKKPGSSRDQPGDLFQEMIDQINKLISVASRECGEEFSSRLDALNWISASYELAHDPSLTDAERSDSTLKASVRGLVDRLLACWDPTRNCTSAAPGVIRALQGIKALLVRWQSIDGAAASAAKRSVGDMAYCAAGGWADYEYHDGKGTTITVQLDLRIQKSPGGWDSIDERSHYTVTQQTVSYGSCPYSLYGHSKFSFADQPPGSEITPSFRVGVIDHMSIAIDVNPVYYVKWQDCTGSHDAWEGSLALGCNPDGTGSDALLGIQMVDYENLYSLDCNDPSVDATVTGMVWFDSAMDDLIPPDLWD
jgi:hypothetical protein